MIVALLSTLLVLIQPQSTANPVWSQSPYFLAGTSNLITVSTSSPYLNTYSIPFSPAATTSPPYLAIGIKSYIGTMVI